MEPMSKKCNKSPVNPAMLKGSPRASKEALAVRCTTQDRPYEARHAVRNCDVP